MQQAGDTVEGAADWMHMKKERRGPPSSGNKRFIFTYPAANLLGIFFTVVVRQTKNNSFRVEIFVFEAWGYFFKKNFPFVPGMILLEIFF